ncbi:MAG: purine-nucleoside phosphorylase [candidate division KSB1 bacterium]|nr:purine-nucleoside phosphorylase [candidate division KSB1 bacterium]MDZ7334053.1 purine-nucleoside phosphorylase [candidate division KSB1 bacterium]MDZ7356875.1 purine-nucleoside phosphorylase [candidate division KSB1 bacterium]MDZ7375878.1 purine-nucleoside phosphorylase [candidate division KSB1 bacterium]MDZ7399541.1 purine-nucleoside phosphorylase [candidate division KSB1 bacterium]
MSELREKIEETVRYLRTKTAATPSIGIILGTGLGALVDDINIEVAISYSDIPNFPIATVEFHAGKLIFGKLCGKSIVAMQGRFHYYEGYSMKQITFPVRVMKFLGVNTLLVSNACGGINANMKPGDIMLITDHINLLGDNPLIGENDDTLGPRFPDMSEPYSRKLIQLTEQIAQREGIIVKKGVYAAMTGPNLETAAEYRFLRTIGADVVGMSTIPEVIVAIHSGMSVLGFSVITDACVPEELKPANIPEIIETAKRAEPKLTLLIKKVVEQL